MRIKLETRERRPTLPILMRNKNKIEQSHSRSNKSTTLPAGASAPNFALKSTPDQSVKLSDFRGRPVALAFYPADWSPVCGDQMGLYNEILPEFQKLGAELLGIYVDGSWCHTAFSPTFFITGVRHDDTPS